MTDSSPPNSAGPDNAGPSVTGQPQAVVKDHIAEAAEREELKKTEDSWGIFMRLMPYLWPAGRRDLKLRIAAAVGCLIIAKFIAVTVPIFFAEAVDVLTAIERAGPGATTLAVPVMLILAFGIARFSAMAFQQVRDALFAKVGFHAQRDVSVETFKHLHALALRFHLERRTGGLARVIDRGTKAIEFLLRIAMFNLIPTFFEIALACGVLWYILGYEYALVVLGTVAIFVWFTFSVTEWRLTFRRKMNASDSEANTKAVDSLLNYETVKYFNNEGVEAARFERAARGYEIAAVKSYVSLSILNAGQALVIAVGFVILLLMSAYGIQAGTMSIGKFAMVQMYLLQLAVPLNLLGFVYREIKQSLVDMGRMFETLDINAEVVDDSDAPELAVSQAEVSFENVEFHYDPARQILKGVSFKVGGGKTLAIVGPTGAGKSTISRALFRFYEIAAGRIAIDGQDISAVSQDSLRKAIGVVPQDTVLFNDTILYNIAYGRPEATRDEIIEAARLARIHDFIVTLPDGYESLVGERGLKLSGGEKQRVAIARTILKNPPILLLDEATSALDTHTEKEIQISLREIAENRTTLIIAHRLSTVVHADEIVVLEAGKISERGTHDVLLAKNGAYARMWNRQLEAAQAQASLEGDPDVV
jgi:ABC-type transport system involved in Fe-S cluster assembly fused permease/ATPase subunit